MAITKATGFKAGDGVIYADIRQAQAAEFRVLLDEVDGSALVPENALTMLANDLPNHADAVLAILTTGPTSRPKARKKGGTTNPKRAARMGGVVTTPVVEPQPEAA